MEGRGRSDPAMSPVERSGFDAGPYVPLVEALTWIAFGELLSLEDLRRQVEGERVPTTSSPKERLRQFFAGGSEDGPDVPGIGHFEDRSVGLDRLTKAWRQLRAAVDRGKVRVRGRFAAKHTLADAQLADVVELDGGLLATFSQFDVSSGGIRRQPAGSPDVLWLNDRDSFDRELEAIVGDSRAAGGYLLVEVEHAKLPRSHRIDDKGNARPNRQLDHNAIQQRAAEMRRVQPDLTIGSAALSIVAELPPNPRTGKQRDPRHIERLISDLWEGGLSQSPP